jgi:adenosylmethionine-8-amino-7-oxononanoate aminotransferase
MSKHFWHPFADMHAVESGGEVVIDHGEGIHVVDEGGRRYIDATASLWYCNVGHGRTEIADAAAFQMRRLAAYSTFGDLCNRPVLDLASRVAHLAPMPDSKIFFTSGGSDAIDTAVKLARRYWQVRGQRERTVVIGRTGSYHGMHLGGTALGGIEGNRAGYGPLWTDTTHVAWDSVNALLQTIDEIGPNRIAAFFCEPVIAAGGVFHAPPDYLGQVRAICRDHGILFVADEVVTGVGRVGDWFASTRFELEPDMITCAKGITSGYLPLGALVVAPTVAEPFFDGTAGMWRHGYTYSGHATAAAAALANLDIMEREDLPGRTRDLEPALPRTVGRLADHDLISEVRTGEGLLAAVQLDPALVANDPGLPARVVLAARDTEVMTRTLATGAIHVSPPLIIDETGLEELTQRLGAALDQSLTTL